MCRRSYRVHVCATRKRPRDAKTLNTIQWTASAVRVRTAAAEDEEEEKNHYVIVMIVLDGFFFKISFFFIAFVVAPACRGERKKTLRLQRPDTDGTRYTRDPCKQRNGIPPVLRSKRTISAVVRFLRSIRKIFQNTL